MAPGIKMYAALQPFLIVLGDIIMVLVLALSVVITIAAFAYIVRRELGWWRQEEEPVHASKAEASVDSSKWHSRAVEDIAVLYLHYDRLVLTNIGDARSVPVGRTYPDIVIKERVSAPEARREPRILLIGQVETATTTTLEHVARWRIFSRLGAPFALFLPQSSLAQAERLVEQEGLSIAQLWGYTYVHGRILLSPGRAPAFAGAVAAATGAERSQHDVPLPSTSGS